MKPNSCTDKAPTDVSPNQEMPVKKHTCTKNSSPQGPLKEPWWRPSNAAGWKHTPELPHACSTTVGRRLMRQGLKTLQTARKQKSQKRSSVHSWLNILNWLNFKRKSRVDSLGYDNCDVINYRSEPSRGVDISAGTEEITKACRIVHRSILSTLEALDTPQTPAPCHHLTPWARGCGVPGSGGDLPRWHSRPALVLGLVLLRAGRAFLFRSRSVILILPKSLAYFSICYSGTCWQQHR